METNTLPAPVPATLNGNAVALTQPAGNPLAMPVPVRAVIERHEAIQEIVRGVFQDGVHFGKIPGTGEKKTLLKPGFDTLCEAFQFSPDFVKQPESIETDKFINLVYKCVLTSSSGRVVATGVGSCNSKEEKYHWTTTARKCPNCKAEAIIKGKQEYGGGWVCFDKKGGCKSKFRDGDQAIEGQPVGRIENDNAWNFHNTLTKMAQKRAGMAAIITACGISGDFTQDMEDVAEPEPNAKTKRDDPGITISGAAAHAWEEDAARDLRDDRPPQDWRDELDGAAAQAEDATFTPAAATTSQPSAPSIPADIQQAMKHVTKELAFCETKEHFQRLAGIIRSMGGPMRDVRVTAIFNERYYAAFPKSTPAPSAP